MPTFLSAVLLCIGKQNIGQYLHCENWLYCTAMEYSEAHFKVEFGPARLTSNPKGSHTQVNQTITDILDSSSETWKETAVRLARAPNHDPIKKWAQKRYYSPACWMHEVWRFRDMRVVHLLYVAIWKLFEHKVIVAHAD